MCTFQSQLTVNILLYTVGADLERRVANLHRRGAKYVSFRSQSYKRGRAPKMGMSLA